MTPDESIQYANAPLSAAWLQFVHTEDPAIAAAEMEYTVEAGSGRRKNKQLLQENAQQMFKMFGQQAYALGMETGDLEAYIILCRQVAAAFDMQMEPYLDALGATMQMLKMMQQAAAGQPGQPGAPGQPAGAAGQTPAQLANRMPGGGRLVGRHLLAAGGPGNPNQLPPPPQGA